MRVFRRILREVKQSGEIHLVVDCSVEKITQLLKASLYTVKKFAIFPSPAGKSLAKLSLTGNNFISPGQGVFG